jgi:hypothetical protein
MSNTHLSIIKPITALPITPPISNVVENIPAWAFEYCNYLKNQD